MNPAASERKRKGRSPEKFCADPRCLWRLASGPCPNHKITLATLQRDDELDEAREVMRDLEKERD